MIDTIARRALLRLAVLGGGALSLGGAAARAAATFEQSAASGAVGTEPSHFDDSEEQRLWRHAGEFGGPGQVK